MRKKKYRPWFRAFSGLFINVSAAFFAAAFIGQNIAFPKNFLDIFVLTVNVVFGMVFLLLTVLTEKRLEK